MQTSPKAGTLGYVSNFIEIFAWLTTVDAYEALWELLWPTINPYGWGYDFWYDGYSRERLRHHKMGIISAIEVFHEQNTSSVHSKTGRTDNADVDVKWNAVLKQEKFYQKFKNITLKRYRSSLKIGDGSALGPVAGYIQAPGNDFDAYMKSLLS